MTETEWSVNLLRLTFCEELSDEEMLKELTVFIHGLKIPAKSNGCFVHSPVEQPHGNEENRHVHLHWLGEEIPKSTKEKFMRDYKTRGGQIYSGTKGSTYKHKVVDSWDEVCKVLRYPLKTGFPSDWDKYLCRKFPDGFDVKEQQLLAAEEYRVRLLHEEEQAKRDESHKNSHGVNLYKAAHTRNEKEKFTSIEELVLYLVRQSKADKDNVTISKTRIRDIVNKLMLEFNLMSDEEFAQSIVDDIRK